MQSSASAHIVLAAATMKRLWLEKISTFCSSDAAVWRGEEGGEAAADVEDVSVTSDTAPAGGQPAPARPAAAAPSGDFNGPSSVAR